MSSMISSVNSSLCLGGSLYITKIWMRICESGSCSLFLHEQITPGHYFIRVKKLPQSMAWYWWEWDKIKDGNCRDGCVSLFYVSYSCYMFQCWLDQLLYIFLTCMEPWLGLGDTLYSLFSDLSTFSKSGALEQYGCLSSSFSRSFQIPGPATGSWTTPGASSSTTLQSRVDFTVGAPATTTIMTIEIYNKHAKVSATAIKILQHYRGIFPTNELFPNHNKFSNNSVQLSFCDFLKKPGTDSLAKL